MVGSRSRGHRRSQRPHLDDLARQRVDERVCDRVCGPDGAQHRRALLRAGEDDHPPGSGYSLIFELLTVVFTLVAQVFLRGSERKNTSKPRPRLLHRHRLGVPSQPPDDHDQFLMRLSGDTRTPLLLNTLNNVLNIILDVFLIFVKWISVRSRFMGWAWE